PGAVRHHHPRLWGAVAGARRSPHVTHGPRAAGTHVAGGPGGRPPRARAGPAGPGPLPDLAEWPVPRRLRILRRQPAARGRRALDPPAANAAAHDYGTDRRRARGGLVRDARGAW